MPSRSRFVFSSTQKKPIVLVGGLNGAGKTTILEAIMVALYGKTYLGRRATKKEYLEFISGKVTQAPRKTSHLRICGDRL